MSKEKIRIVIGVFWAVFMADNAYAQDSLFSMHSRDRLMYENLWLSTNNAAGSIYNPYEPDGDFSFGYNRKEGELRYRQQSPEEDIFSLIINKSKRIKNIVFNGGISYYNLQQKDVGWTSRMNPMTRNPYLLADSLFGLYKKDYVALKGGVAILLSKRIALGLNLNYLVGDGARIKDPRPKNRIYSLKVLPALIYSFETLKVGLNLQYVMGREEIKYNTKEQSTTYRFFRTFGLGKTSTPVNGWNYYRNYYLDGYGGDLQFDYKWGNSKVLTGAGYLFKKEASEDGKGIPQKGDAGDYKERVINFYSVFNRKKRLNQQFSFQLEACLGTGVEYLEEPYIEKGITYYRTIAELENYSLIQLTPIVNYAIAKPYNELMNKWELNVHAGADIFQSEYIYEAESSYTNLNAGVKLSRTLFCNAINFLDIKADGQLNYNMSSNLNQLSPYEASQEIAMWERVIQPNFLLDTANKYGGDLSIRYGYNIAETTAKLRFLYLDVNMGYRKGTNDVWNSRKASKFYGVKIGMLY